MALCSFLCRPRWLFPLSALLFASALVACGEESGQTTSPPGGGQGGSPAGAGGQQTGGASGNTGALAGGGNGGGGTAGASAGAAGSLPAGGAAGSAGAGGAGAGGAAGVPMCPPGFDIGLGGTPCDAEGQFCALEACGACQSCSLLGCANHIWAGVTLEPNAATCKGGMLATDPATCTPGAPGCYPEAPLGWSGPYLLKSAASTEPEPECPADWGSESLLSTGGTKSSVECSCACGEPQGVVCEATSVTLQSCSANGTGRTVSTQCADFGNNGFTSININAKVILPGPSGGSCGGAGALTQKKTERTFESRTRQCSVAKGCPVGGSCGTGVDPGDGWTACVTASFPFNCPAAYPSARVLQLVGEDTLACGACSDCQAACGGTVSLYNEKSPSTCASAPVSVIGAGCAPTGFVNTARFDPAPPTCSSSSSPTGDPGVGPDRYFCCLP